ncbi:hypothetical protein D3C79_869250 [compost metagenome]
MLAILSRPQTGGSAKAPQKGPLFQTCTRSHGCQVRVLPTAALQPVLHLEHRLVAMVEAGVEQRPRQRRYDRLDRQVTSGLAGHCRPQKPLKQA